MQLKCLKNLKIFLWQSNLKRKNIWITILLKLKSRITKLNQKSIKFKDKNEGLLLQDTWAQSYNTTISWIHTLHGVKMLNRSKKSINKKLKLFKNKNLLKLKSSSQRTIFSNNLFKSQKTVNKEQKSTRKRRWLNPCTCKQWATNNIWNLKLVWGIWEWSNFTYLTLSVQHLIRRWRRWVFGILGIQIFCIKLLRRRIQQRRWKLQIIQSILSKLCLIDV